MLGKGPKAYLKLIAKIMTSTTQQEGLSVQFGCGVVTPDQWLNYDASPTRTLSRIPLMSRLLKLPKWPPGARYGDIIKGLPVPLKSCRRVYSDQVLEHLALEDFRKALRNIRALLLPDGVFRAFVPDLEYAMRVYQEARSKGEADAASQFVIATGMGHHTRRRGFSAIRNILGNSAHLWAWDEANMRSELEQAGFRDFKRMKYLDSGDPLFDCIENYSEYRYSTKSLGFEVRPG